MRLLNVAVRGGAGRAAAGSSFRGAPSEKFVWKMFIDSQWEAIDSESNEELETAFLAEKEEVLKPGHIFSELRQRPNYFLLPKPRVTRPPGKVFFKLDCF